MTTICIWRFPLHAKYSASVAHDGNPVHLTNFSVMKVYSYAEKMPYMVKLVVVGQ